MIVAVYLGGSFLSSSNSTKQGLFFFSPPKKFFFWFFFFFFCLRGVFTSTGGVEPSSKTVFANACRFLVTAIGFFDCVSLKL